MTDRNELIHIIGINAFGVEGLTPKLQELTFTAERIAAPSRILKSIPLLWKKKKLKGPCPELLSTDKIAKLIPELQSNAKKTVLLASGDPLWFGIGRVLLEKIPRNKLFFHPAPTSLQLAFARLGRPWQDASWISLHGRDPSPLAELLQKRPSALAVLTDPSKGVKEVRQFLRASGLEKTYAFWIFENLGHPKERIQKILPNQEIGDDLDPLNLVVLIRDKPPSELTDKIPLFGIEDGFFLQYSDRPGLMTKKEIRVQLLAELELPKQGVIWDICAGVGSIGLEALRIRPELKLFALDKRIGCKDLIKANAKRLSVKPVAIYETEALIALTEQNLPSKLKYPDRVLLGGGGSNRASILKRIIELLKKDGIIVIPLTTIDALNELETILRSSNCDVSLSQHQAYRGVPIGKGTRLSPMNPVFILKGTKT